MIIELKELFDKGWTVSVTPLWNYRAQLVAYLATATKDPTKGSYLATERSYEEAIDRLLKQVESGEDDLPEEKPEKDQVWMVIRCKKGEYGAFLEVAGVYRDGNKAMSAANAMREASPEKSDFLTYGPRGVIQ